MNNQRFGKFISKLTHFLWLNGNNSENSYVAIGCKKQIEINDSDFLFSELQNFLSDNEGWKFGFLSYDLKNNIENLFSENPDNVGFPKLNFFIPETLLKREKSNFKLEYGDGSMIPLMEEFIHSIPTSQNTVLQPKLTKEEYLSAVKEIKSHIQQGDIYEMNFCHEFYNDNADIDPFYTFIQLNNITKAPFSCFGKFNDKFILSASPERFIKKEGNRVITQPIKGTSPRSNDKDKDEQLKEQLKSCEKERSENIMIVDLVRNDFSKFAAKNSVQVDELCEIYSFETVHQMISTVSCEAKEGTDFTDIIKACFPMGSMTGAPKIRSMELIEKFESTKRGLYSGTVGYIKPNGDFDFNVIIRSLLYNQTDKYLSCMVGGAITSKSDAEKEYEETLLKVRALLKALK